MRIPLPLFLRPWVPLNRAVAEPKALKLTEENPSSVKQKEGTKQNVHQG